VSPSRLGRARAHIASVHALCALVVVGAWLVLAPIAHAGTRAVASTAGVTVPSTRARAHHRRRRGTPGRHGPRALEVHARAAIVGGTQLAVGQAPWQVAVEAEIPIGKSELDRILCGGSIIDESHILTAAHCVFIAPPDEQIPPSDFMVRAGTVSLTSSEPTEQDAAVSGVRVHPYYTYAPESGHVNPDDVAVLTLAKPLVFGPDVSPIALVAPGAYSGEGTAVGFTGFGEESAMPKALNDELYSLGMTVGFSRECGGENGADNAVLLCASAPSGSPCEGDSGSALTVPEASPALAGVMNDGAIVAGQECTSGARNSFANVAAPEIQDFIDGSESPPRAPRGGGASCTTAAPPMVGGSMTCQAGSWSNSPTFTYAFIDSASGQTLQSGASPDYQFSAAAVGSTVFMRVQATNAGGTGIERTAPTAAVVPAPATESKPPAPRSHVTLGAASIAVQLNGTALVKLACVGHESCRGKLALTVTRTSKAKGRKRSHVVTIGTVRFAIAAGRTTTVKLKLTAAGRALLGTGHGRLGAHLAIVELDSGPAQTQSKAVRLIERV
jgi:hypothetical protein